MFSKFYKVFVFLENFFQDFVNFYFCPLAPVIPVPRSLNRKKYSSRDGYKFNDACPALFPVCLDISKGRQKKKIFLIHPLLTKCHLRREAARVTPQLVAFPKCVIEM